MPYKVTEWIMSDVTKQSWPWHLLPLLFEQQCDPITQDGPWLLLLMSVGYGRPTKLKYLEWRWPQQMLFQLTSWQDPNRNQHDFSQYKTSVTHWRIYVSFRRWQIGIHIQAMYYIHILVYYSNHRGLLQDLWYFLVSKLTITQWKLNHLQPNFQDIFTEAFFILCGC